MLCHYTCTVLKKIAFCAMKCNEERPVLILFLLSEGFRNVLHTKSTQPYPKTSNLQRRTCPSKPYECW